MKEPILKIIGLCFGGQWGIDNERAKIHDRNLTK